MDYAAVAFVYAAAIATARKAPRAVHAAAANLANAANSASDALLGLQFAEAAGYWLDEVDARTAYATARERFIAAAVEYETAIAALPAREAKTPRVCTCCGATFAGYSHSRTCADCA